VGERSKRCGEELAALVSWTRSRCGERGGTSGSKRKAEDEVIYLFLFFKLEHF
jgi:hypothetical protein